MQQLELPRVQRRAGFQTHCVLRLCVLSQELTMQDSWTLLDSKLINQIHVFGPATCPKPHPVIINGAINEPQKDKSSYTGGETVEYKCSEGFVFENETIARCTGSDWTYPKCIPKTLDCGPPPSIEHAVQDFKEQYKDGETATYDCPSNYIKDGDPYMICSRGRWIGKGKCLHKSERITLANGSIAMENKPGELGHPCLQPQESVKASDMTPLVRICDLGPLKSVLTYLIKLSPKFMAFKVSKRKPGSILSNAFSASMDIIAKGCPCLLAMSII
ncbi:hypothetical protein SRHO_G00168090 [Serrasalmus rhombeus]